MYLPQRLAKHIKLSYGTIWIPSHTLDCIISSCQMVWILV